jgi:ribokinase
MSNVSKTVKIIVVGSANTDMVIKTARFPQPGETILGGQFFLFPGGKGANQSVAAARLGGAVTFVCKVGNDIFGQNAVAGYAREGIDTSYVLVDEQQPSGVALITVNAEGQNEIVVASGANAALSGADVAALAPLLAPVDLLLTQLETPLPSVVKLAELARAAGKRLILNPAPAQPLPAEVYQDLFLITPNETETELLTGIKVSDAASAAQAAQRLVAWGVQHVIITLGAAGVYVQAGSWAGMVAAPRVQAVDTTAAGDVFNGAVAVALAQGLAWPEACAFACRAASLSVTRLGAQASAPYAHELE